MPERGVPLPSGVVTFLLTDIEGSTQLWDTRPDDMADALARHEQLIDERVAAHGGQLLKSRGEGDATLSVFARASDAVAAAVDVQREIVAAPTDAGAPALPTRIALHTGEAQLRDGDYYGGTLNRAARIRALADGGEILCSRATRDVVAESMPPDASLTPLGEHQLRGLRRREDVYAITHPSLPPLRARPAPGMAETRARLGAPGDAFVGRTAELDRLDALLDAPGLVTLTGAGGIGKTRLAMEAAARTTSSFEHVWVVPLAGVVDADAVASAIDGIVTAPRSGIAAAGPVPAGAVVDRIVEQIARRRCLVLVDNCEQVSAGVRAVVEQVLGLCPNVTVLATSRERVHLAGERTVIIEGLDDVESLDLLMVRARAADDRFNVDDADRPLLTQICRTVDGMPLAVELAAARLASMTPSDLVERLPRQLDLLRGLTAREDRHDTVHAAIEWSHRLLDEREQVLLRRLAVFRGGFGLAVAERVCHTSTDDALLGEAAVFPTLEALVSKSLVVFDRPHARYRLLEPIRLYAAQCLARAGEATQLADRHADWVFQLARELFGAQIRGDPDLPDRLLVEGDNIEAAINFCSRGGDDDRLLRIVTDVATCWSSSDWRRGLRLIRRATLVTRDVKPRLWARALLARGRLEQRESGDRNVDTLRTSLELHRELGDRRGEALSRLFLGQSLSASADPAAEVLLTETVEAFRELGDPAGLTWSLLALSVALVIRDRYDQAQAPLDEAAAISRQHDLRSALGVALSVSGSAKLRAAQVEEARAELQQSTEILRELDDRFNLGPALALIGWSEHGQGDMTRARTAFREAAEIALEMEDRWGLCDALIGLATVCLEQGDDERAQLLVAATGFDLAQPPRRALPYQASVARALRRLVEAIGPGLGDAAAEARRLGPEAIAQAILDDPEV